MTITFPVSIQIPIKEPSIQLHHYSQKLQILIQNVAEVVQILSASKSFSVLWQKDELKSFIKNPTVEKFKSAQHAIGALRVSLYIDRYNCAYRYLSKINSQAIKVLLSPPSIATHTTQPETAKDEFLKYTWNFAGKKLCLYEKQEKDLLSSWFSRIAYKQNRSRHELWLYDQVTRKKELKNDLLEELKADGVVTTPLIIFSFNECVLYQTSAGLDFAQDPPIKTWLFSDKRIDLVCHEGKSTYRIIQKRDGETYLLELPVIEAPSQYYPVEENNCIIPTVPMVHHIWERAESRIELVQVNNDVFCLFVKNNVATRIDPQIFPDHWTSQQRIAHMLTLEPELNEDRIKFVPLSCAYTWKGDTECTLMYHGDNLWIRVLRKIGDVPVYSRFSLNRPENMSLRLFFEEVLSSDCTIDETGMPHLQDSNIVHQWDLIDGKKVCLIRRRYTKDGVEQGELEYLSVNQGTLEMVRKSILLEQGRKIEDEIASLQCQEPLMNADSTVSGWAEVLIKSPSDQRKQISLLGNKEKFIWRVRDQLSSQTQRIPVDFARDFPIEAQISFLKNQISFEDTPTKHEKITKKERENLFDYQLIKSGLKTYLFQRKPTQLIENVYMLKIPGISKEIWEPSSEFPILWEFYFDPPESKKFSDSYRMISTSEGVFYFDFQRMPKSRFIIRRIQTLSGIKWATFDLEKFALVQLASNFKELNKNELESTQSTAAEVARINVIRLLETPEGFMWSIFDPEKATVRQFPFNFNEIMKEMPIETLKWFVKGFQLDAFDTVNHKFVTKKRTYPSRLDPTKIIDNDIWAVSLVNSVKKSALIPQHAMLAIEGVKDGEPFFRYAHISSEEGVTFLPFNKSIYQQKNGLTWLRERPLVIAMLESLFKDITNQQPGKQVSFSCLGGAQTLLASATDYTLIMGTVGLWPLFNVLFKDNSGLNNPTSTVNCMEFAQQKLTIARVFSISKLNVIATFPNDYLVPEKWHQSACSLTGPVIILIPIRYLGKTLSLRLDISDALQEQLGNLEWSPIGLCEQNIWKSKKNFEIEIEHPVIYSIRIRNEITPRFIDVTNFIRKNFSKMLQEKVDELRNLETIND